MAIFGPNDCRIIECPSCGHIFSLLDLLANEGECLNFDCGKILTSSNRPVTKDPRPAEVPFYDQHDQQNVA